MPDGAESQREYYWRDPEQSRRAARKRKRQQRDRERVAALLDAPDAPDAPDGWRDRAACRGMGHRLFFAATRGENGEGPNSTIARARRICETCPVQQPCLDEALTHPVEMDYGVWAGTTPHQRRTIRSARRARRETSDV